MDIFQVHHPQLGVVAAKVMKNEQFDSHEWDVSGKLCRDSTYTCPFIIRNILAKQFDTMTVLILEYCNIGV
ncbi:MAG: hypothetical protein EZS28_026258 [Streblomastix strix]|uniref:Protein kinase domain-containing protein n=1 Tax=Streblomastix strix TaxID=222440 RepID=A0A5J4V7R2_9EUKA|nr:MAG: hypothetical protein EZS28_026258 [Streblomastix strix]